MTLKECMNEVATSNGWKDWDEFNNTESRVNILQQQLYQAALLYGEAKFNEGTTLTRLDDGDFIFSGVTPSEINEYFYTREKPTFKP